MQGIPGRFVRSLREVGLLLGCICALDAWAGSRSDGIGVGITIVRSIVPATAHDGQVDGHTLSISGTLSATAGYSGQALSFSIITPPADGTVTIVDPATGSFSYTAHKRFKRGVDSFTFHVTDNHGVTSNIATEYVLLRIKATTHEGGVTTFPDTPVTGTLSAVPSYNGETLTFVIVKQPDVGAFTFTDLHSGAFSFTPLDGFSGRVFVRFRVMDPTGRFSNTSVERITVMPIPATAIGGSMTTGPNQSVTGVLSATTAFASQLLTFRLVTPARHGKVVITDMASGAFKYTPAKDFKGQDKFTFRVTDQNGTLSNTAIESITVH